MFTSKNFYILFIQILITLTTFYILEISYRFLSKNDNIDLKVMLYQIGKNFKNEKDFIIYHPNQKIRHMTLFTKREIKSLKDIIIETDYFIETNNLGLVMKNEISQNDNVILIIGDSFTEGQGDIPWFYKLEDTNYNQVKLMNLGIMGSGPMGWLSLTNYVKNKNKLKIEGAVINIILPDLLRQKWTLNQRQIDCLQNGFCEYKGAFQGIDFNEYNTYEKIINYEFINKDRKIGSGNDIKINQGFITFVKSILKKSKLLKDIYYGFVKKNFMDKKIYENNINAILKINQISKDNLYVNIVSTKKINQNNYKLNNNYNNFIEFLKIKKINYSFCNIDADGFHKYDDHPNKKGYNQLKECTSKSLLNLNNIN